MNGPKQPAKEEMAFLCFFLSAVDKLRLSWLRLWSFRYDVVGWLSASLSLPLQQGNWPHWLILKRKKEARVQFA